MADKILNFDEIKAQFPNEWILLGLSNSTNNLDKSGIVLYHSADYLELCYKGSEIAKNVLTTIFYTGNQKPTRKWLKATRLKETPTTI